ncbi:hypothetical protein MQX03_07680 [Chryseobacterium aahli]|uniref:hypothetical protein n=1 Tax=Chryseobacterium aahli TaxID=1278643 RepID=UPI001F622DF4|nr:hypothetical protein [Chryseobacterium aahli]MCI3937075.1 hypothetical protein [Chryseobacterium aahli]
MSAISSFNFLNEYYPALFNQAMLAESLYYIDASSSIAKTRLFYEKLIQLIAELEIESLNGRNQLEVKNNKKLFPAKAYLPKQMP